MNMWVQASLKTPSPAERAAIRSRLWGRGNVVNIAPRPKLVEPPKEEPKKRPEEPHDAHVKAYEESLAQLAECPSPNSYVRMRCKVLGVSYEEVTTPFNRYHNVVRARRLLIREVKARFPLMSSKRIALIFGEMHHSSVLKALQGSSHDPEWRGLPDEKIREIKRLRADGMSYREIAAAAGIDYGTVQNHLKPGFREMRNLRRRKRGKAK